jgi:integral membrane protein
MRRRVGRLFVLAAIAEAISWLALLIGMAVKYGPPGNEIGVQIFGPVHGGLFIAYVGLALVVSRVHRWSWLTLGAALICAIPPFATLGFERWAHRRGLLTPPSGAPGSTGPDPAPTGAALADSTRR